MTDQRRDLSGLSSPPNRAAGLGHLPQRLSPTSTSDTVSHTTTEREEVTITQSQYGKQNIGPVQRMPWVIYLPQQVHDAAAAARGSMPWSEWILDAYRHVHAHLDTHFALPITDDSGLPPRKTRARHHATQPREKQLKLTETEINVLEEKMKTLGESNRSAFITAVVELRLAQLSPQRRSTPDV